MYEKYPLNYTLLNNPTEEEFHEAGYKRYDNFDDYLLSGKRFKSDDSVMRDPFGGSMKFVFVLVVLLSFSNSLSFAEDCTGMCKVRKLECLIEDQDECNRIMEQIKIETDSRQKYGPSSPEFLESYGKFLENGVQTCTANIVANSTYSDSHIITTAAHCIPDAGAEDSKYEILFTRRNGSEIYRKATILKVNKEYDYALLKLDKVILNSEIKPLDASKTFETVANEADEDYYDTRITCAGYSGDKLKGESGRILTYDLNCYTNGSGDKYIINTNCTAYKGASGGALVIEYTTDDGDIKRYFGGVNHAISLNPDARGNKPQVATFIRSKILMKDLQAYLQ